MITFRHELYLECDGNGEYGNGCTENLCLDDIDVLFKHPTAKSFIRIAIKIGWKIDKNECYCPYCKKQIK